MRQSGFQPADSLSIWAVSDGRVGIANQCLGLAEAVAARLPARISHKRIGLRTPWRWLPAGLIPAPRQALALGADPIAPPWPDLWIACGRASLSLSMGVREWSAGRTLVVQLQDPRINPREFDLVIPPAHDGLEGQNVLPILGSCHRVSPLRVETEAAGFHAQSGLDWSALPRPRIAVLIGGKSKRQTITARRARAIAAELVKLKRETGGALLVTLSRRTPEPAARALRETLTDAADLLYPGAVEANPYFAMLAAADVVLVTEDSVNMAAEAASLGKPVLLIKADGEAGKLAAFTEALIARGCARWYVGGLETWDYAPLRETDRAAEAVVGLLERRSARPGRQIAP